MKTIDERAYLAMLDADLSGDTATADRLAMQIADKDRAHDADSRNRALVGRPVSSRVGLPRGPMGESS